MEIENREEVLRKEQAKGRRLQRENEKLRRKIASLRQCLARSRLAVAGEKSPGNAIAGECAARVPIEKAIAGSCPEIMLMMDRAGRFVFCTDAFLHAMRMDRFDAIDGQCYQHIFVRFAPPEWIAAFAHAFEEVIEKRRVIRLEMVADIGLTAEPRTYTICLSPVETDEGAVVGVMALFHDETEILYEKEQAQEANRAKANLLLSVSHEARTPMSAIVGLSGMLGRTSMNAEQTEMLGGIREASRVLLALVNDVVDFAQIETGRLALQAEYFRLHELVEQLEAMFAITFRPKRLTLVCDYARDLPAVIFADMRRLRQVAVNLLSNAFARSERGNVWFYASMRGEDTLCFQVTDLGPHVPDEVLASIFQPFVRQKGGKGREAAGAELGLTIAHQLCELMGGELSIESDRKATTFTAAVPIRVGTFDNLAQPSERAVQFIAPQARALVVDDVEMNRLVTKAMLESFRIRAACADNGRKALAMVKKVDYDIIFMDHMMPGMDGIETTQAMRRMQGVSQAVPVVALTANVASGARDLFLASGFNDYLPKPIELDAMAECLLRWLPEDCVVRL